MRSDVVAVVLVASCVLVACPSAPTAEGLAMPGCPSGPCTAEVGSGRADPSEHTKAHDRKEDRRVDDDTTACSVVIDTAGLKHRGDLALERDRGAVSLAAHFLAGTSDRGEERTTPAFSVADVAAAIAAPEPLRRRAGALLAGRCGASGRSARQLTALVVSTLENESDPSVAVELAMSALLRGEAAGHAHERLIALVALEPGVRVGTSAAAYLAQLGDVRGWRAVERAYAPTQPTQVRVDAVMAAPLFGPLQGADRSGTGPVDPHGLLASALADPEIGVRQAAIAGVVEVGHPEAVALLTRVEASDPSPGVKVVAANALWHLRRASPGAPAAP